jgi:hypothetical protein
MGSYGHRVLLKWDALEHCRMRRKAAEGQTNTEAMVCEHRKITRTCPK